MFIHMFSVYCLDGSTIVRQTVEINESNIKIF
jgi:hypothetical protein